LATTSPASRPFSRAKISCSAMTSGWEFSRDMSMLEPVRDRESTMNFVKSA
jgi:hypothetical protein